MQDLRCDWLKYPPPPPPQELHTNVLPHGKYDLAYNPCIK